MAFAMKNTFASFDRLKNVGMTDEQARTIVEVAEESAQFNLAELATKSDLLLTKSELEAKMADMKTELKVEIAEVRTEITGLKSSVRSLQGMFMSGFLVIFAGMVLSFFHH